MKIGRIDRYELRSILGEGGSGVVYSAFDTALQRPVALKLLSVAASSAADAKVQRERLLREAKAMARLSHPNLVKVHDAGMHEGNVYVVMDYVDGETLRAWRARAEPDWRATVAAMLGAGAGLAAAHEAGFVHRDFKPDNVIVDPGGRAYVFDFGLVRALVPSDEGSGLDRKYWQTLTRAGAMLGTPEYMPSEQLGGGTVDARSDQYAFCATLFELLYGRRPYTGDSPQALIDAVLAGELSFPTGIRIPAHVRRVLERGLSRRNSDRYPSMQALLTDLHYAISAGAPRRPLLLVAGGVSAFVVAGVLATALLSAFSRRDASPEPQPIVVDAQIAQWPDPMMPSRTRLKDAGQVADAGRLVAESSDAARGARDAGRRQRSPSTTMVRPSAEPRPGYFDSLSEYDAYLEALFARDARACLREATTPHPSGNMSFRFTISSDGTVSNFRRPSSGTQDEGWKDCVVRRVRGRRYASYNGHPVGVDPVIRIPSQ